MHSRFQINTQVWNEYMKVSILHSITKNDTSYIYINVGCQSRLVARRKVGTYSWKQLVYTTLLCLPNTTLTLSHTTELSTQSINITLYVKWRIGFNPLFLLQSNIWNVSSLYITWFPYMVISTKLLVSSTCT